MIVKKALLLASMALSAVAFSVPAGAQAQTHGLTEGGAFIGAGSGVTITSTDLVIVTSLGTITCGKVTLHYTVETNTDEHVALSPVVETANGTTEKCHLRTSNGTLHPVDIGPFGTDTVTFNTWGTASVATAITVNVTFVPKGSVTCTFKGNLDVQANMLSDGVTIFPSVLAGGLCGNGESFGTGTIETSNGTALIAGIKATP